MTTGTATYSPEDNKLRLYPLHRLDPDTYARVRAAGFIWAPKQELFVAPMWTPAREDLLIELCDQIDDEDKSLVDRAEERAERFEEYSENRAEDANRAEKGVKAIADNIPFGQPILVGHHSEKHARKDAERIENGMRKTIKMWEESKYWESRAKGAIRAAKYKERPDVRARRIKGLEADLRKENKIKKDAESFLKLWENVHDDTKMRRTDGQPSTALERAKWVSGYDHLSFKFTLAEYPRETPASQYEGDMSLWSALDGGIIGVNQAAARAIPAHQRMIAYCERWISHLENRLVYERAMLESTGGTIADRTKPEKGGACKCWASPRNGGWSYIQKVNRISVTVFDDWGRHGGGVFTRNINFDQLKGVMTAAEVQEKRDTLQLIEAENKVGFYLRDAPLPDPPGPEKELRALWDKQGVTKEKQDELIKQVEEKAQPGAKIGPFTIGTDPVTTNKKLSIETDVIEILKKATFTADSIELPAALDRPLYVKVNKALEAVGGKWDTKRKAHIFGQNPAELFDIDNAKLKADKINIEGMKAALKAGVKVVSAPQLFPTPQEIADRMIELAEIEPGNRILEPSAGTGNLLRAMLKNPNVGRIIAIEINYNLNKILAQEFGLDPKCTLILADFLEQTKEGIDFKHPETTRGFDRIIMNPPFEKGVDIKHIKHALTMLAPGGRLVALCANGPRQQEAFKDMADQWEDLPEGSFKAEGTNVNVALMVINKEKDKMMKKQETPYLSQEFKKRTFPQTKKEIEMHFKDTPLFKAQVKAEFEAHQPNLFEGKVNP